MRSREGGRPVTEAEWITSLNSRKMMSAVSGKGSDRLWRLFAVGCARRFEPLMRDQRSRLELGVAERYADGEATREELRVARDNVAAAAHQAGYDVWLDEVRANFGWDAEHEALHEANRAARAVLPCVAENLEREDAQGTGIPEWMVLPDMLREVFGNPFQWTTADPLWLTRNDWAVANLAQTIYAKRDFDQMPILADALEDAGCCDEAILRHCRERDGHTLGCWVLDLCLGLS